MMTKNNEINPQIKSFESLSFKSLVSTDSRVFTDIEEEKMLSVLRRSLDNTTVLSEADRTKLTNLMNDLIVLSAKNKLKENILMKSVREFESTGISNLEEIKDYLKIRNEFDTANLIRNSNEEAAKDSGSVDLLVKIESGDLTDLTTHEQDILNTSSSAEEVLKNNIRRLSESSELGISEKERLTELFEKFHRTTMSFDKMTDSIKDYLENDQSISTDTKETLSTVVNLLKTQQTDEISNKIKSINNEELLRGGFRDLSEKLEDIKSERSIIEDIQRASTAEELGSNLVDSLFDKFVTGGDIPDIGRGKGGLLSKAKSALPVLGKVAGGLLAGYTVFDGIKKLWEGKAQSDIPSGVDLINPMSWGMWLGDKINKGYGSVSRKMGGTGSLGSDIYDMIHSKDLGSLSAKHESGSKGISAIGYDPEGGTSYGKYQLSSRKGSVDNFLNYTKNKNPEIYNQLSRSGPSNTGSTKGSMPEAWKKIAQQNPEEFDSLQHGFIQNEYYNPTAASLMKNGIDVEKRSKAFKDVIWSTAVHHGVSGAVGIISKAFKELGMNASDGDIIPLIYKLRSGNFKSSPSNIQASVKRRFAEESNQALAMLDQESKQNEFDTEANNLRMQGMSEDEIERLAGLTGNKSRSNSPKSSIEEKVASVIQSSPSKKDESSKDQGSTQIANNSTTIINSSPNSGFNLDVIRHSSGV